MKTRNYSIDSWRLVASLFVVFIHCGVVNAFPVVALLSKASVPYFFAVSGYFLYKLEDKAQIKTLTKSVLKVAKTFFIAFAGFLLWSYFWYTFVQNNNPSVHPNIISPKALNKYIFSGDYLKVVLFEGTVNGTSGFGVLWFLLGSFFCLGIILILRFFFKNTIITDSIIIIFSIISYIIPRVYYHLNIPFDILYPRWFKDAFIFVALGYFIRKFESKLLNIPRRALFSVLIIAFVLHFFEQFPNFNLHILYEGYTLALIPLISVWLIILTRFPNFGKPHTFRMFKKTFEFKGFGYYGKTVGLHIYLIHSIVWFYIIAFNFEIKLPFVTAFMTYFVSFFVSVIYSKIKARIYKRVIITQPSVG